MFSKKESYWIIITLKNGRKIAGKYGTSSFVSNAPYEEQIYLEETWVLDGSDEFKRKKTGSCGIIITSGDIDSVELFEH